MALTVNWQVKISSLVMAAILLSSAALAQAKSGAKDETNPDEQAVHDYILTMDKVHKYVEVAKKVDAARKADPAMAAEMKKLEDSDAYNVQKVAIAEQSSYLSAFFKTNSITARDYIFTPMTVFTAALAIAAEDAKQNPPAFVNPENMKFVREHKAELEKENLFGLGKDKSSEDKGDDQ